MGIVQKVREFVEGQRLLSGNGLYLVAVSGGADSVCLLLVMQKLGYHVEAVHCNFKLRGSESDRDENFVRELCNRLHLPLHLVHFDTREYAQFHKLSIEMAARELRYGYFEQLRLDLGAEAVCVAHHRDDSIETVLLNLIRGTGLHGLTGIKPRNGHIIRPLLCLSREEIERFLKDEQQPYVTDSTNLDADEATRNRIRLELIPLMKTINPSVSESIQKTAEHLIEASHVVDEACKTALRELKKDNGNGQFEVDLAALRSQPSPELLLFELLTPYGFGPDVVRQLSRHLDGQSGKLYRSASHLLITDRNRLVVEPKQAELPSLRIPEMGTYVYHEELKFRFSHVPGRKVSREPNCASLDEALVKFPLCVRPVRQGERFIPFGMTGSRLVSDFLTDRKLTLLEKQRQLVVCDADDHIVWLVGQRPDQRFCLTPSSAETLLIEFIPQR